VKYWLHPEAAEEHKKQIAHYEEIQTGLGSRYHNDFKDVLASVCSSPDRFRIVLPPNIRRAMFKVFHFDIVYREVVGSVQVLAIAHHRRQPGYWVARG
jgi:plasmid stabilization system protein ParE